LGIPALLLLLPPVSTIASTTITTIAATPPAPAMRTRGDAWRRLRPLPFDWTGGGADWAARRICLLFLPLGIGRKRTRLVAPSGSGKA